MQCDRYAVLAAELDTAHKELARATDPQHARVLLSEIRSKLKELDAEAQRLLQQPAQRAAAR